MTDPSPKHLPSSSPSFLSFDSAPLLSRWTFFWLNGLLRTGYERPLQTEDVPPLPEKEHTKGMAEQLERIIEEIYKRHQPGSRVVTNTDDGDTATGAASPSPAVGVPLQAPPSFALAIWRLIGTNFLIALVYAFISETLAFAGPILVQLITEFLDDSEESEWHGWLYVALLFVLPTIASVCRNAYFIDSWRVAVRLRSAILAVVFRKSLKLSPAARRLVSDGEVLTIMSTDVQKLTDIWPVLFVIFTAPLSIFACFVLIWLQLGPSTLAGAGVIAILMPLNIWLGKRSGGYRREEAAQTDLRMRFIKESMSNMKVIKQYGWSSSFETRIMEVREKEIEIRQKAAYLEALSNSILILTPVLISLVTFLTFAGSGNELTATNVFTSMALFNVMRFQLSQFPQVLTALFEARISLQRILRLILREELSPDARDYAPGPVPLLGETIVKVESSSFSWDSPEEPSEIQTLDVLAMKDGSNINGKNIVGTDSNFRLNDINLDIKAGSFVAIVGSVGSGKSSLLQTLLGEVKRISLESARIYFRGRVAFVPQTAWILNLTLRDNILFGLEYDEEIYQQVIEICCLKADLEQLPGGDATQIGDKVHRRHDTIHTDCMSGLCVRLCVSACLPVSVLTQSSLF